MASRRRVVAALKEPLTIGETALFHPPFSPPGGKLFWKFISTYNRCFAQIARWRRREGRSGMTNRG